MFFEISLFPITIIILGYGYQIEKINSSFYLLFFTLICSIPFFFILFNLDLNKNLIFFRTFFSWELEFLFSILFILKFPIYFLHFWLPKAHVEAPTTASILLAGLLLKLGTGGFLRLINSLNFHFLGFYYLVAFVGIIIGSFNCIFQSDLKALSAFSSINHISFVLLSLIFIRSSGLNSSIIIILSHGFISTLIFYFIGEFYHSIETRLIYFYSGIFSSSIFFCLLIRLTWLFNGGVPFSLSFYAEFITFLNLLNFDLNLIFFGFIYFFLTFYYCLFFVSINFIGKLSLNLNNSLRIWRIFFLLINCNIFFLCVFI